MLKSILADRWLNIGFIILVSLILEDKWSKHDFDLVFWLGIVVLIIRIPLMIIEIVKEYNLIKNKDS